jgi:hypothetical protein
MRSTSSPGLADSSSASLARSSRRCCTYSSAPRPVTASIRRSPEPMLASERSLKKPIWPVRFKCVPPQSSTETSPVRTMRTRSPYFSPKRAVAP